MGAFGRVGGKPGLRVAWSVLLEHRITPLLLRLAAGKLGPAPLLPPDPPMPPPPPPLPKQTNVACTPRTEKDTDIEKCTAWCADSKSNANAHKERCNLCKCHACSHCAPPIEQFVTVDVLDRDEASSWLGYWQRFNLSAVEWRGFEAVVPLPPGKRGHVLEVTLVVGYAAATYLIDDVSITQRDSPASERKECIKLTLTWGVYYG